MAAVKFYKKLTPDTKVGLENRNQIEFTSIDGGILGYYATNQEYVQQQFEKCMRENRYCITEISAEEFDRDYVKKKGQSTNSRPVWREEVVKGKPTSELLRTAPDYGVLDAVAVRGCDSEKKPCGQALEDGRVIAASQLPPGAAALTQPPAEFTPPTGRRNKATRGPKIAPAGNAV